jgi:hypothetical protein
MVLSIVLYLMKPLPPPRVAIEFKGFTPTNTEVFHMELDTNDTKQVRFRDGWHVALASSTNYPTEQTNAFCTLYLTNQGPTRIWWISMDCAVEARTPQGWVTNYSRHYTTIPWSVGSQTKDKFIVYVPIDAIEWRVTGDYSYYPRHVPCFEFQGWLVNDLHKTEANSSKAFIYMVMPVIYLLALDRPPNEISCRIASPYFTNRPPAVITP